MKIIYNPDVDVLRILFQNHQNSGGVAMKSKKFLAES